MNANIDQHINHIENLICERICTRTGYAADHINVRTLMHQLKYSDRTDCGLISSYHFNEFLVRMNVVGIRDVDMLFNRYDDDYNGFMDYRDFAHLVFGGSGTSENAMMMKRMTTHNNALEHFHTFRQFVVKKDDFAFVLRFIQNLLTLSERDRDGYVTVSGLFANLVKLLPPASQGSISRTRIAGINRNDLQSLLQTYFDVHKNGKVHIASFVKRFKSGMSIYRKKLIRAVFDNLDVDGKGYVSQSLLEDNYRENCAAQGFLKDGCRFEDMWKHMQLVESLARPVSGDAVSWPAFLDYYRCLSLGIEDDYTFDVAVRQSWTLSRSFSVSTPFTGRSRMGSAHQQRRSPDHVAASLSPLSTTSTSSAAEDLLLWKQAAAKSPGSVRRRLLVTHSSGKEEVVEIVDEIGRTKLDSSSLHGALNSMGLSDISDIKW